MGTYKPSRANYDGSTSYGDSATDKHIFSGSVLISGSLILDGTTNISGASGSVGTDTLNDVTSRGNTTANSITVGSFTSNGDSSVVGNFEATSITGSEVSASFLYGDGSGITNAQVSGSNLLWVDISGSDTTGTRERFDKPYASIGGALSSASAGDVVVVRPGIYEEVITMVSGVSVTGMGRDRCVLKNYSGGFTVTMADNCAFEHMSLDVQASDGFEFTGTTGGTSAIRHTRITSTGGASTGISIGGTPAPAQNWITCDHVDVKGSGFANAFLNQSAGDVNFRDCFGDTALIGLHAASTSTTRAQDCRFSGFYGIYIPSSGATVYVDQSTRWSSLFNAGGSLLPDLTHLLVATGSNNEIQISSGSLLSSSTNLTFDGSLMAVTGTLGVDGNITSSGTYNGVFHYESSATDPSSPAPSAGDIYYNTSTQMEMRYDGTRSKWLSTEVGEFGFGRNGQTAIGAYYKGLDSLTYTSDRGRNMEFDGTVISITYTRDDTDSAVFEAVASGVTIASLSSSVMSGSDMTLDTDFSQGQIMAVRNSSASANKTNHVNGTIRFKWRTT
tara:strand:- start:2437 stop:4116 length:1680 start_codon:yes stop_codon:yes gene_type:complete